MKLKLPWRITLAYLALIFALFLASYLYLHFHLRSLMEEQEQARLNREAQMVKALWQERFPQGRFGFQLDAWADQIAPYLQARITVIDGEGKVWGDSDLSGTELRQVESHRNRPEVQEALANGIGRSIRYSSTLRCRMLYLATRLEGVKKGSPVGVIRLAMPLSSLDRLYSRANGFLLATFLSALLLGLLFAYAVSRLISRPILEMAFISRRMADGDFSKRVPIRPQSRELAELGSAINRMAQEIGRAIQDLSLQKRNLEAVLSGMTEGVMVIDTKERIALMNRSLREILSLPSASEGSSLLETIRHAKVQEMVKKASTEQGKVLREEIVFPGPPLRIFQVSAVSTTPEVLPPEVVCVFSDITELRRLEQIRRDFLANASHELKSPLSSIKGYAETLLDGALEDRSHAREFVETILRQADHLAKLINDLLDLAKIESGKMELRPSPLPLQEVIPKLLETFQPLWESKQLHMEVDIPSTLPPILADQDALRQILSNLLDNAIKFTPPEGKIMISASPRGDRLRVEVKDTGVGIASANLSRIFERFYQADPARPRSSHSTGLGLAIVKHLVIAQGGEIWAESRLGAGSIFFFTLPLAPVAP